MNIKKISHLKKVGDITERNQKMKKALIVLIILTMFLICYFSHGETTKHEESLCVTNDMPSHSIIANDETKEKYFIFSNIKDNYIPLYGIMINCEAWSSAQEIPVYMYYAWYREYVNSITTVEERKERYTYEDIQGWAYPKLEFENFVEKYFIVDSEYLQNSDIYKKDLEIYSCEGGRATSNYKIELQSLDNITINNNLAYVKIYCTNDFESDAKYFYLVIDISCEPYKFISCLDIKA